MDRRQKDLDMVQNPQKWPYSALPMKRYLEGKSLPSVGLLVPTESGMRFFPGLCIFSLGEAPLQERLSYPLPDPKKLLDEGWMVD